MESHPVSHAIQPSQEPLAQSLDNSATTPQGLAIFNLIRAAANRKLIHTDPNYGGPIPVVSFLTSQQTENRRISAAVRPAYAERYFRTRPQFGNIGVPDYTSDVGTLPLYNSHEQESISVGLHSIAEVLDEVTRIEEEGVEGE